MDDPGNRTGNQSRCSSFIREDCECIHRKRFLTPLIHPFIREDCECIHRKRFLTPLIHLARECDDFWGSGTHMTEMCKAGYLTILGIAKKTGLAVWTGKDAGSLALYVGALEECYRRNKSRSYSGCNVTCPDGWTSSTYCW